MHKQSAHTEKTLLIHTDISPHTHKHIHAHTHARTHTCAHTHTCYSAYCSYTVPSGVRNLSIITMNATTLMILWMPPLTLNGILTHYLVTVNEQEFSRNDTSLIVTNLGKH